VRLSPRDLAAPFHRNPEGEGRMRLAWIRTFALAALFLPAAQTVAGQSTGSTEGAPLSLTAAVDEALQNNPELIALRRQYDAARQRPAQDRFLMAPSFEAQIWQWPINTLNPLNTGMYMVTISQDLPGRGKRQLKVALAQKDAELSANEIAIRGRDVVEQVKRTYAELFVSRRAIEVQGQSIGLVRQLADVSTAKYAAGRAPQQDVLRAVVEISKLQIDLVTRGERAQLAEAELNTLLARPPQARIGTLAEPPEDVALPSPEELQQLALLRHPELTASRLGVERAQAALNVTEREYKPDFMVGGGYMLMPRDRDAWTASVGISWPTARWARGRLDAQKAEAEANIEAARAGQRAAENRIRLAVQDAYIRVKSAGQRAALLRTTILPQSEQTLEVSRVAYQTDRVDFLALLDNQRVLVEAQLDYEEALSELEQARADLERAVGVDLPATTTADATSERR